MQSTRGKLLVSTRAGGSVQKIAGIILSAIFILLGLFFLINEDISYELARDLLGKISYGNFLKIVIPMFFILYAAYILVLIFRGSKSFVEVYENAVVGVTKMDPKKPTETMQSFELGLDEIVNVSESKKCIQIYTRYTAFEVTAMKNRTKAVQEIRSRMTGKQ